jgi:hypothetical protein
MGRGMIVCWACGYAVNILADSRNMKAMKCTACQASVLEMSFGILRCAAFPTAPPSLLDFCFCIRKENDEQRKLREVEVVEILEKVRRTLLPALPLARCK